MLNSTRQTCETLLRVVSQISACGVDWERCARGRSAIKRRVSVCAGCYVDARSFPVREGRARDGRAGRRLHTASRCTPDAFAVYCHHTRMRCLGARRSPPPQCGMRPPANTVQPNSPPANRSLASPVRTAAFRAEPGTRVWPTHLCARFEPLLVVVRATFSGGHSAVFVTWNSPA